MTTEEREIGVGVQRVVMRESDKNEKIRHGLVCFYKVDSDIPHWNASSPKAETSFVFSSLHP